MKTRLTPEDLEQLFFRTFSRDVLHYRPASDSWQFEKNPISNNDLIKLIAHRCDQPNQRIANMLVVVIKKLRDEARMRVRKFVEDSDSLPTDDRVLRRFLQALCHAKTERLAMEANLVAVKQAMWMVKRNAIDEPVKWQVMPIFWSTEHGTGKSFNVLALTQPFEDFTRHIDVNEINEKFSGKLMSETLLCVLDDLEGSERRQIGQLKAILTGKPFDRRSMHSESGFYAKNRLTCMATSNLRPPHGFIDTSGMRRFWSIECSPEVIVQGGERATTLDVCTGDAKQLWAAVDARGESPHESCPAEVREYMASVRHDKLRTPSSIENFVRDRIEYSEGSMIGMKEFQALYKQYCAQSGQYAIRGGYKAIADQLKSIGVEVRYPSNVYRICDRKFINEDE